MSKWGRITVFLVSILVVPGVMATTSPDPAGDERVLGPVGTLEELGLVDCDAPAADLLGVTVVRDGSDLTIGAQIRNRTADLTCGTLTANWLDGSSYVHLQADPFYLQVIAEHDDWDGYEYIIMLAEGDQILYFEQSFVPFEDLWDGDEWQVRFPVTGSGYDLTGKVFHGRAETRAVHTLTTFVIAAVDEATIQPSPV